MKLRYRIVFASMIFGVAQAWAGPITVDGNLADWGIDPSTWLPSDTRIHYRIEDQSGNANAYLNPGWGGQAYDAEAMYALIQDNRLYVALVTGHDPRTLQKPSANSYGAGDFFIDLGLNGTYELAVNVNHRLPGGFESDFIEGGVYQVGGHALGLFPETDDAYPVSPALRPTYLTAGEYLGLADLVYTTAAVKGWGEWSNDKHYFYELSVGLDLLRAGGWDGDSPFNIHWTMNCANDSIWVDPPAPNGVPEPATLALLPLGLAGMLALRRRRAR